MKRVESIYLRKNVHQADPRFTRHDMPLVHATRALAPQLLHPDFVSEVCWARPATLAHMELSSFLGHAAMAGCFGLIGKPLTVGAPLPYCGWLRNPLRHHFRNPGSMILLEMPMFLMASSRIWSIHSIPTHAQIRFRPTVVQSMSLSGLAKKSEMIILPLKWLRPTKFSVHELRQ